jgi:hypothetical protein
MAVRGALALLLVSAGCGRLDFDVRSQLDAAGDSAGDATGVPWVLEQHNSNSAVGSATLSATVAATAAGDLIVVGAQVAAPGGVASIADNAGTAYQRISGASALATAQGGILEIWYAPTANAGATTITVTANMTVIAIVVWEFRTSRVATVDAATQVSDQPQSANPAGPAITTRSDGELVIAAVVLDFHQITGIAAGNAFTNDELANANGWAHLTDPSAPAGTYQATWNANVSDSYCASAVAFVVQ